MARLSNQTFGLSLYATLGLAMLAIMLSLGAPAEELALIGGVFVFGGIGALLTHRRPGRATAGVGLVITLAIAAMTFFGAFGITLIFSPIDFIVSMLWIVAFIFSIVGAVQALRLRDTTTPTAGRVRMSAVGVMGVLAIVSIAGFFATRTSVESGEASDAFTVEMADFEFAPADFSITAGTPLLVTNEDLFAHDITIADADIHLFVGPGSERLVDMSDLGPGTHTYICSLHSDGESGMMGTITIEE